MAGKSIEYFSRLRTEILPLLPMHSGTVLDVGCGSGVTGGHLRETGRAGYVVGIEVDSEAAVRAREKLDEVYELNLLMEPKLPWEDQSFDLVLALDVLEHLIDPWSLVSELGRVVRSGGRLVLSVPNIRHVRVVVPLILFGRFRYNDAGILDNDHLRFFTLESAIELGRRSGLTIERISYTGRKKGSLSWTVNLATLGLFRRFLDIQYLIVLRK